jgi:predicted transcriptional regulator
MVLVYLDVKDSILLKSNDTSFHALYYILFQMDLVNNTWYADRINKQDICNKLSVTPAALEKMLKSLRDREILVQVHRGKYKLTNLLFEGY